jgi:hypothetical protein
MKTSALFTLILLGAMGQAAAQPEPAEPNGRVSYTENAAAKPAAAQQAVGDEVEIATPTPATHGTEFVVVGKEAGPFSQLRLAATTGRVIVRTVRIFFDDGSSRAVQVDSILDSNHNKDATIDLKGVKSIDHLTVTTEPGRGSYALYGTTGR